MSSIYKKIIMTAIASLLLPLAGHVLKKILSKSAGESAREEQPVIQSPSAERA